MLKPRNSVGRLRSSIFMVNEKTTKFPIRVIFAFIAGFESVLIFHQGTLSILHAIGVTAVAPSPYGPTKPFGLPQIWSLAFWGGIWGVAFALVVRGFPRGAWYIGCSPWFSAPLARPLWRGSWFSRLKGYLLEAAGSFPASLRAC